jgi:pantoate--beta-alanine ligase
MKIITSIKQMKEFSDEQRKKGKTIGFIPTMGYLHEGHLSLMKIAKKDCDLVIVSIYVNPTQFGPNEDLNNYPRDFERDKKMCEEVGADIIFYPSDKEMYPNDYLTYVKVEKLSEKLCGATRPTHFRGVTTIVLKLFEIVKPNKAYFGLKDYQQFVIVKKMVDDLNLDVEMVGCPIVREKDGLTMSSRNVYLNPEERKEATVLSKSLFNAKKLFFNGEIDAEKLKKNIKDMINKTTGKIDYIEIFNPTSLEPVKEIVEGDVIALTVFFGKTRLIDNVILE